eukprot:TRINITY_DN11096_c0_g2_i1.p1 TRINITY_DN11096_c0_g2~~TRINITY_DN11096_c0_g2_i1.p1  ORF type:complete len:283 (+),score=78.02 TRINITY_DN11096_c0_g2_i1:24-851(+)
MSADAAVGGQGLPLPPGLETPIMIHIAVLSVEQVKEKWDFTSSERLGSGRRRKEVATELFKKGRVRLASSHYDAIADLYSNLDFFKDPEERQDAKELYRIVNLNRAACLLKLGDWKTVVDLCTNYLKDDARNAKALFRRAKAFVGLKKYTDAIEDLNQLLEIESSNVEGQRLLREAKLHQKKFDKTQAFTFSKMCNAFGSMSERSDRRDDNPVVAPDLNEEYAKISAELGVPLPKAAKELLKEKEEKEMRQKQKQQPVSDLAEPSEAEVASEDQN